MDGLTPKSGKQGNGLNLKFRYALLGMISGLILGYNSGHLTESTGLFAYFPNSAKMPWATGQNKNLAKNSKIFCWIMTSPQSYEKRAIHVNKTWAPRCDESLFVSSIKIPDLPSVAVNVTESHDMLWGKTKAAFQYIWGCYNAKIYC